METLAIKVTIKRIVRTYCAVERPGEYDAVLADIKRRIKSTISDRTVVNHSVIEDLQEYFGHRVEL